MTSQKAVGFRDGETQTLLSMHPLDPLIGSPLDPPQGPDIFKRTSNGSLWLKRHPKFRQKGWALRKFQVFLLTVLRKFLIGVFLTSFKGIPLLSMEVEYLPKKLPQKSAKCW